MPRLHCPAPRALRLGRATRKGFVVPSHAASRGKLSADSGGITNSSPDDPLMRSNPWHAASLPARFGSSSLSCVEEDPWSLYAFRAGSIVSADFDALSDPLVADDQWEAAAAHLCKMSAQNHDPSREVVSSLRHSAEVFCPSSTLGSAINAGAKLQTNQLQSALHLISIQNATIAQLVYDF